MPRGRHYTPSVDRDGFWFHHRGGAGVVDGGLWATSTGKMQTTPFRSESAALPVPPPVHFRLKEDKDYKTSNRFSGHDNRNSLQDHGVYFGNGNDTRLLGKHLIPIQSRLHHSDQEFLDHRPIRPTLRSMTSLYGDSFHGKPTQFPPVHRRFPKSHGDPAEGSIKLDTTTTDQFKAPEVPHTTPLHVLALSQEPFTKHNAWKFSYQSMRAVYPSYNVNTTPLVDNILNRHGANFMTESSMRC